MTKFLEFLITKLKGSPYKIDDSLSAFSILYFVFGRVLSIIRAVFVFRGSAPLVTFAGSGVNVVGRNMLSIGKGCTFGEHVYINAISKHGAAFGKNVSIGPYSRVEVTGFIGSIGHGFKIGSGSGIGAFSFIGSAGGVQIGENVIMGQYVSFHSENHNFDNPELPIKYQGVTRSGITIGDNCWVGAKVTFLDGARVGSGCVIAAGAVVRGEFPDNVIIGGVPAKIIKNRF